MKIYISHSSNFDYKNELYEPLKQVFSEAHELYLPHDAHNEGVYSKDVIHGCDLILAEVSYPSTGQGIELGWAEMSGVPIKAIYKRGTTPSSAVRLLTNDMFEYEDINEALITL